MVAYRWKEEKKFDNTDSTMNWGLGSTQHYCSSKQKQQYSTKPCQPLILFILSLIQLILVPTLQVGTEV